MSKARLVNIQFDPETFISVMVGQAFEPDIDHALWEIDAPLPTISDLPAGDYSLYFSLPRPDKKAALSISLINEEGHAVKFKHMGLAPMFSGFADAFEFLSLEAPQITEDMSEEEELSEIFRFLGPSKGHEASNKRLADQGVLFREMLGEFCDFKSEHDGLINQLYGQIVNDASILITNDRSDDFQGNFTPENPKRH